MGAKVNGRLVSLLTRALSSGETVEVVTSKSDVGPVSRLARFCCVPRARSKIKAWFSKERREEAIEAGKEALARTMRRTRPPAWDESRLILSVATSFSYPGRIRPYAACKDDTPRKRRDPPVDNPRGDGTEETLLPSE